MDKTSLLKIRALIKHVFQKWLLYDIIIGISLHNSSGFTFQTGNIIETDLAHLIIYPTKVYIMFKE